MLCFTQGTLAGLLIGLGQLNCSELRLKRLCCRSGLLGIDRVMNYALSEWMTDIRGTQLPRILGGVGPVHSFLQLFQGLVDLVWLPIDQYRRDGRVMRGLQRGANSFTTSSAMAFLELTNRVVQMIQVRERCRKNTLPPANSLFTDCLCDLKRSSSPHMKIKTVRDSLTNEKRLWTG